MRSAKVIYLPQKLVDPVWEEYVKATIGARHDLRIYDENEPIVDQFQDVEVVIDNGGAVGTQQMMDAAKNVRLWQIHATGIEKVDIDYLKSKSIMVANCPGQFSSVALAECAMLYILMLTRYLNQAVENFRKAVFHKPVGHELEPDVGNHRIWRKRAGIGPASPAFQHANMWD